MVKIQDDWIGEPASVGDKQRLEDACSRVKAIIKKSDLREAYLTLDHLVGKTQNQCTCDGPQPSGEEWTKARNLNEAVHKLLRF